MNCFVIAVIIIIIIAAPVRRFNPFNWRLSSFGFSVNRLRNSETNSAKNVAETFSRTVKKSTGTVEFLFFIKNNFLKLIFNYLASYDFYDNQDDSFIIFFKDCPGRGVIQVSFGFHLFFLSKAAP